jgi:hypothetical protein
MYESPNFHTKKKLSLNWMCGGIQGNWIYLLGTLKKLPWILLTHADRESFSRCVFHLYWTLSRYESSDLPAGRTSVIRIVIGLEPVLSIHPQLAEVLCMFPGISGVSSTLAEVPF